MYVYPGITEEDGVVPRMTIVDGYEMCTELYDPLQPEVIVYHYMNSLENRSVVMSASSHGMTILEEDPFQPVSVPKATLITIDGSDLVVSGGVYSKQDDAFTISSVRRIENYMSSNEARISSRSDDMDFARALVMKDIIAPISKVADYEKHLPEYSISEGAKLYLLALKDFAVPVAEGSLYSNNQEEFIQITGEKIYTNQLKKIKCIAQQLDRMDMAQRIYHAALAAYRDVRSFEDEKYDDLKFDFVLTTTDSYSFTSRQAQASSWKVYDDSKLYKPTLRLLGVEGQSATVRGDFTNSDGRFTVTGYYLYCDGAEVQNVKTTLNGVTPYTFNNLTKGKTYQVTSYAAVMGTVYESPAIEFRIDGDLELATQSLTFSEYGGSSTVEVTAPSDVWTWKASSNAKWCEVAPIDDHTLQVKVAASNDSREAKVTVTSTSPDGDTQVKIIEVKQSRLGDYLCFSGKLKLKHIIKYPSKPEYNYTQENDVEMLLLLLRMGGTNKLTFSLPLSGITFTNWPISTKAPSGTMLEEGIKIKRFVCTYTDSRIAIDGTTEGPNNETTEFTLKIDLATLEVMVLEAQRSTGFGKPDMTHTTEYQATSTLSGTLKYTDGYQ